MIKGVNMKKTAILGLVVSTVILTGCTQQSSTPPETTLEYNSESDSMANSALDAHQQTESQTMEGSTMKKLEDFEPIEATQATIVTNKGEITFELYGDKTPITVANFLNLAKSGFYEGIKFHRIIPAFMAQVGDPLTKDDAKQAMWGTGGPGYTIPDEFDETLKHDSEGIVSMANAGPGTGGSQIFITYEATPWLDGKHTVFGKVTSGMDVLRKLEIGDTIVEVKYK